MENKNTAAGGMASRLTRNWIGFAGFIKENPLLAGVMAACLALVYAGQAFNNYYYIDKEILVNSPGSFYNWNEIGRFGLIFIKKLLGMSWYNPYLNGILLLVALWLAAMAGGYLFRSIDNWFKAAPLAIFMLLFLVYPTYVDQFLFQYQAFEVMLAVLFLMISNWYLVQAVREHDKAAFLVSNPLVVLAYGIYQNMVSIQLCLYLGTFLVMTYAEKGDKSGIRSAIAHDVLHFAMTLAGYGVISLFFWTEGENYLGGQLAWSQGVPATLRHIVSYFGMVVKNDGVYYTCAYLICCLIGAAAFCLLLKRYGKKSLWYALGLAGVAVSPLFMSIVMGGLIAPRIQMTLPLANGILWLFGFRVFCTEIKGNWGSFIKALAVFAGVILIFVNTAPTMRIFYTRDVIGKADEMTTTALVRELEAYPATRAGKPIIFIGHREALTNPSCSEPDKTYASVFISAYEVQYSFEPQYFFSTCRLIGYFKTLGYDWFCEPDGEMMPSAYERSLDMQVWPCTDSIREYDEYVVIKLGEE